MKRENITFDELQIGDSAEAKRLCLADDIFVFANSSGNDNPVHLPAYDGDGDGKPEAVMPAMWTASLISAVLGARLPGPGTLYRGQALEFGERAFVGDELVARVEVVEKGEGREVRLKTSVTRASDGAIIASGEARVVAPERKMSFDALNVPGLTIQRHRHFDQLIERAAQGGDPIPTAVIAPEEPHSLGGAVLGAQARLIRPILIGDAEKISAAAKEADLSLEGLEILDVAKHREAAEEGVALVRSGRAGALMKGHLHTDELLHAVMRREKGLRTGRRLTHVFVMDVPGVDRPLLITDAAINIDPDLETKIDIVQNAIDLALSLGIDEPRVGVLSAVEHVNPKINSSLDAALLSKMAERGQIKGGIVDGPLAMDNAIDLEAAKTKGIKSPVAGKAEVLVAPNLDTANMLAKELTFLAHAEGAGLVIGAKAPIILTSRADDEKARLASCAVAALHWRRISGEQAENR